MHLYISLDNISMYVETNRVRFDFKEAICPVCFKLFVLSYSSRRYPLPPQDPAVMSKLLPLWLTKNAEAKKKHQFGKCYALFILFLWIVGTRISEDPYCSHTMVKVSTFRNYPYRGLFLEGGQMYVECCHSAHVSSSTFLSVLRGRRIK